MTHESALTGPTYAFPVQTEEAANEPTKAELRAYRRAEVSSAVRRRLAQIWASMERVSAGLDQLAAPLEAVVKRRWCALLAYAGRYFYRGEYRGQGRNWSGRPGRRHVRKNVGSFTKSTPDELRIYDEPSTSVRVDEWSIRMQARINNANIINSGAEGPLEKE